MATLTEGEYEDLSSQCDRLLEERLRLEETMRSVRAELSAIKDRLTRYRGEMDDATEAIVDVELLADARRLEKEIK